MLNTLFMCKNKFVIWFRYCILLIIRYIYIQETCMNSPTMQILSISLHQWKRRHILTGYKVCDKWRSTYWNSFRKIRCKSKKLLPKHCIHLQNIKYLNLWKIIISFSLKGINVHIRIYLSKRAQKCNDLIS